MMALQLDHIRKLLHRLLIYRSLSNNPFIEPLLRPDAEQSICAWFGSLLEHYPGSVNPWAAALRDAVVNDENYFSLTAERKLAESLPQSIISAVRHDLTVIAELFHCQPELEIDLPAPLTQVTTDPEIELLASGRSEEAYRWLSEYYQRHGAGIFGKQAFFVWDSRAKRIEPVTSPDPVTIADLIGYQSQKETLMKNTQKFLNGLPANNVLLYGDRGTGKSSLVKAVANQFRENGLRLIEVNKTDLTDFPDLINYLSARGLFFIIYVDDLSFEVGESQYKQLKAVLEGSLSTRPRNLLIYATSNRRHLIRETMTERDEDIHFNDTIQEKLSLADRFGITITFLAPDQEEYLSIVRGLARQRGLKIPDPVLTAKALCWERLQNGRSGRTARQFIDDLQGETAMEATINEATD